MTQDEIMDTAIQAGINNSTNGLFFQCDKHDLNRFAQLVAAAEREAIYQLVMEAPFKEFDRQEEDFDGEAANAIKAMAFSLTSAIRARGKE